jgi:phosphate transport system protein
MKHLERDLEQLHRHILALSASVEETIDKAGRALRERRRDLAEQVLAGDDDIDRRDVEIEEECLKMLALHQPVAIDLRRIATVLKINSDLERIGDLAANIAERAKFLIDHIEFPIPSKLERMIELSTTMVRGALDAFVNLAASTTK